MSRSLPRCFQRRKRDLALEGVRLSQGTLKACCANSSTRKGPRPPLPWTSMLVSSLVRIQTHSTRERDPGVHPHPYTLSSETHAWILTSSSDGRLLLLLVGACSRSSPQSACCLVAVIVGVGVWGRDRSARADIDPATSKRCVGGW